MFSSTLWLRLADLQWGVTFDCFSSTDRTSRKLGLFPTSLTDDLLLVWGVYVSRTVWFGPASPTFSTSRDDDDCPWSWEMLSFLADTQFFSAILEEDRVVCLGVTLFGVAWVAGNCLWDSGVSLRTASIATDSVISLSTLSEEVVHFSGVGLCGIMPSSLVHSKIIVSSCDDCPRPLGVPHCWEEEGFSLFGSLSFALDSLLFLFKDLPVCFRDTPCSSCLLSGVGRLFFAFCSCTPRLISSFSGVGRLFFAFCSCTPRFISSFSGVGRRLLVCLKVTALLIAFFSGVGRLFLVGFSCFPLIISFFKGVTIFFLVFCNFTPSSISLRRGVANLVGMLLPIAIFLSPSSSSEV